METNADCCSLMCMTLMEVTKQDRKHHKVVWRSCTLLCAGGPGGIGQGSALCTSWLFTARSWTRSQHCAFGVRRPHLLALDAAFCCCCLAFGQENALGGQRQHDLSDLAAFVPACLCSPRQRQHGPTPQRQQVKVQGALKVHWLWWKLVHLLHDDEGIDEAAQDEAPKEVPPPLPAGSIHRIVGSVLVMQINPSHAVVVKINALKVYRRMQKLRSSLVRTQSWQRFSL